jgi:hypothetical protein
MKPYRILIPVLLTFLAGTVLADENYVTVYNQDLGMIKQVRTLDTRAGNRPLRFTDVAAQLIPASVHLRALEGGSKLQVLEQNFEFDLVSSEKILDKYVDHPVEIASGDGDLITGTLLSRKGNSLVLKTADGIQIIPFNDKLSIRVKELPEGLITRPTLIWELAGTGSPKENLEVSYLTTGMNWQAAYVGILEPDGRSIDLKAWVSIDNRCGATFDHAHLKLVAGEVHRAAEPQALGRAFKVEAMPENKGAPPFQERSFFEYHIYQLDRPTTVKDNQIKQIALFPAAQVKSEKKFFYNAQHDPKSVEVRVVFKNEEKAGLGKPLPAGVFRLYQKDQQSLEFIGEDHIEHTPRNEEVKVTIGKAFDLTAERKVIEQSKVTSRSQRQTIEIELHNNKPKEEVTIGVEEAVYCSDWQIESSNFSYTKKDIHQVQFSIPVKADGAAKLRYTLLCRW